MSDQKLEQAEWEVVDTVGPQAPPNATRAAVMRAMFGPWWRWKMVGVVLLLCAVLALVFAMAGVLFVAGLAVVLVSLIVAKVRQLLRHNGRSVPR